MVRKLY